MDGGGDGRVREGRDKGAAVEVPGWVRLPEKTLYWWSFHLSRLLKYCRVAGREASEDLATVAGQFLIAMREARGNAEDEG